MSSSVINMKKRIKKNADAAAFFFGAAPARVSRSPAPRFQFILASPSLSTNGNDASHQESMKLGENEGEEGGFLKPKARLRKPLLQRFLDMLSKNLCGPTHAFETISSSSWRAVSIALLSSRHPEVL